MKKRISWDIRLAAGSRLSWPPGIDTDRKAGADERVGGESRERHARKRVHDANREDAQTVLYKPAGYCEHGSDICTFVVERIANSVLDGETEVWSQEWMSVLTRWKLAHNRDPIAESKQDKDERFGRSQRVLRVVDYCSAAGKLTIGR